MLWRHRFITDTWGWELPGGIVDQGETPEEAAAREFEEETGWRPTNLRPLTNLQPANGLGDCVHHVFWTDTVTELGSPEDTDEAERLDWVPLERIPDLIRRGDITASTTAATLLLRADIEGGGKPAIASPNGVRGPAHG